MTISYRQFGRVRLAPKFVHAVAEDAMSEHWIVKLRGGFSSGTNLPRHRLGGGIAVLGVGRESAGFLMRWH